MATKARSEKEDSIGKLKLTEAQAQLIAEGVQTDFFKLLEKVVFPNRRHQISLTLLNMGETQEDMWRYKGMAFEGQRIVNLLKEAAKDYEKRNGDMDDGHGVDPVDS